MRDARSELSHRFELLGLALLLVALPALRHVDDRPEDDASARALHDRPAAHHPPHGAVGPNNAILALPLADGDPARDSIGDLVSIVRVHQAEEACPDDGRAAGRQTENRAEGVLPYHVIRPGIPAPQPDARDIDGHAQLGLALAKRLDDLTVRGHVRGDDRDGDDQVALAHGAEARLEAHHPAIAQVRLGVDRVGSSGADDALDARAVRVDIRRRLVVVDRRAEDAVDVRAGAHAVHEEDRAVGRQHPDVVGRVLEDAPEKLHRVRLEARLSLCETAAERFEIGPKALEWCAA